eukprot:TRINITY_DN110514_c0_g1_i1.p1 TRINITY_DN110514_c0_g1~~TRINITY_DN110514_c0_g1_i1.p1  ORF type:complete len:338 (+),score=73.76 TRINITY_DN110514_c0_g1_i1:151-1014(+)
MDVLNATVSDIALSLIGVEHIDTDEPLMDAGLDSLAAVEFQNTLSKEFQGVELPGTLMFDYPSVKLLSSHIDGALQEIHTAGEAKRIAAGGASRPQAKTTGKKVMAKRLVRRPVNRSPGAGGAMRGGRPPSAANSRYFGSRERDFDEADTSFGYVPSSYAPPSGPRNVTGPSMSSMSAAPAMATAAVAAASAGPAAIGPYQGPSLSEISETVKDIALSLIGVESLEADEPLMDAGLDSLAAVEFVGIMGKEFSGFDVPGTLMFDYPSVSQLAQFVDAGMREAHDSKK